MILSAKLVKKPVSDMLLICEHCYRSIHGKHIRLYGMAHEDEKPYTLIFHIDCISKNIDISQEVKIQKVLEKVNI